MICPKCQQLLPQDSTFCQYCGSKIEIKQSYPKSDHAIKAIDTRVQKQHLEVIPDISDCNVDVKIQEESKKENNDMITSPGDVHAYKDATSVVPHTETAQQFYEKTSTLQNKNDNQKKLNVKSEKKYFCKICGSQVNYETKKCPSCGKQYFRFPKKAFGYTIITIVFVTLVALNVYQFIRNQDLQKYIENKDTQIANLQKQLKDNNSTISSLDSTISSLNVKIVDLTNKQNENFMKMLGYSLKADFLDNHIVIVADDGTRRYHKYGCKDLDLSYFWAYNLEAAISQGYRACPKCN